MSRWENNNHRCHHRYNLIVYTDHDCATAIHVNISNDLHLTNGCQKLEKYQFVSPTRSSEARIE